jgi:alkylation response protein AidB-like acyl-CoA dehydrogenase
MIESSLNDIAGVSCRLKRIGEAFVDRLMHTKQHLRKRQVSLAVLTNVLPDGPTFDGYTFSAKNCSSYLCILSDGRNCRLVEVDESSVITIPINSSVPTLPEAGIARVSGLVTALAPTSLVPELEGRAVSDLLVEHRLEVIQQIVEVLTVASDITDKFTASRVIETGFLIDVPAVRTKIGGIHARISLLQTALDEVKALTSSRYREEAAFAILIITLKWSREIIDECIQLHGGRGYIADNPITVSYCEISLVFRALAPVLAIELHRSSHLNSLRDITMSDIDRQFGGNFGRFLFNLCNSLQNNLWNDIGMPREVFAWFGTAGYLGKIVADGVNQRHSNIDQNVILIEQMVEQDEFRMAISTMIVANTVVPILGKYGSKLLKDRYLIPILSGKVIACFAVTEEGSGGSMVSTLETTARRCGDVWKLNGKKCYITNAPIADVALVLARTERTGTAQDFSLFCVPTHIDGVRKGKKYSKLGAHASETGELNFVDCEIPSENIIGYPGGGLLYVLSFISEERILIAVAAITFSLRCIERVSGLVKEQGNRRILFEQKSQALVLRLRCRRVIGDVIAKRSTTIDAALLKYMCGDFLKETIEICSGILFWENHQNGHDEWLEKLRCDARVISIFAGPSEVMADYYSRRVVSKIRERYTNV